MIRDRSKLKRMKEVNHSSKRTERSDKGLR